MPTSVIIDDDAAGELADLVVIDKASDRTNVALVHCKWSSKDYVGQRLEDVEVVLSQAVRSLRWASAKLFWRELRRRLRERNSTRIINDPEGWGIGSIDEWAEQPPRTAFRVFAVQPGLLMANVARHAAINTLLVSCYGWAADQDVPLVVVGSSRESPVRG
jgi:hypothetical protein